MEQDEFKGDGWQSQEYLEVIEEGGMKKVFLNGRLYMIWEEGDELSQRIAVAQIHALGTLTQEQIAKVFKIHPKSVYNQVQAFKTDGADGLISQKRGPKSNWKLDARVRSKILVMALKEGIFEPKSIQKRLEQWGEEVNPESIRQVLVENGIIEEKISQLFEGAGQRNLFDDYSKQQLFFDLNYETNKDRTSPVSNGIDEERVRTILDEQKINFYPRMASKPKRYYSRAQRMCLDQLERGDYNTYAGGLLFVPLLQHYSYLPTIRKIINIDNYEGYTLEELCLTLFYFDIFNFRSLEDYKNAYPEEFGTLIGRSYSPSLFTLRRFLDKVKEQKVSEKLIDEFGLLYLKEGLAKWGVLYIDGHFLPYYGIYLISMGWDAVRKIPMKGSHNFMGVDVGFNPWIFLVRSSKEDLLQKIPEMIEKAKSIGKQAGISQQEIDNLIVMFDREGFSGDLLRYLDGRDRADRKRRVIFATWAKYTDKWVYDVANEKFDKELTVQYKIQKPKRIKYFETDRVMSKYGKIRTIVVERETDKRRAAIYTNAEKTEIESEVFVQLLCRRWGEENLIKELIYKHLIDYWPGYETEDLEEQPLVDNPKMKELKQQRTNLKTELSQLKSKFGDEVLEEMEKDARWEQIREKHILTLADIEKIRSQVTLLNQAIDELPEQVRFDEAYDGKKLVDLNYERKRFLDCIKVFSYNMKNKMCQMLLAHYDKKKEILPALSKIVKRTGYVKLEKGKLQIRLRRFKNVEIDYAARQLCEDLNEMRPVTLDKFRFPIHYEVL